MLTCQHLTRSLFFCGAFLIALLSFTSCGHEETYTAQASLQMTPVAAPTKENDKQFLARAITLMYDQIMVSKLAHQRATMEEVKNIAGLMEETNRNSKSALSSLAIVKAIPIPTATPQSSQAAYDTLYKVPIEEFDFSYITLAIANQNAVLNHLESASRMDLDGDLKAKVAAMIPEMRSHLTTATSINGTMNPLSLLEK